MRGSEPDVPLPEEELTITFNRPPTPMPGEFWVEWRPGPYMYIEIKGHAEKVEPFAAAIAELAKELHEDGKI